MAVVKSVNKSPKNSIGLKATIEYVGKEKEESTERVYKTSGINCSDNHEQALKDFVDTKKFFNKEDGRQCKHLIQSFKGNECSPEVAHKIAKEWASKTFPDHEVFISTHTDTNNVHNHIVINSVNMENGKKLQMHPTDLKKMKVLSDELCVENNLSIIDIHSKGQKYDTQKSYYADLKAAEKGTIQHKKLAARTVEEVANKSTSKEDFINKLKDANIKAEWQPEKNNVMFEYNHKNQPKKVGLKRLHTSFLKEIFTEEKLIKTFAQNKINQIRGDINKLKEEQGKFSNKAKSLFTKTNDKIGTKIFEKEKEIEKVKNQYSEDIEQLKVNEKLNEHKNLKRSDYKLKKEKELNEKAEVNGILKNFEDKFNKNKMPDQKNNPFLTQVQNEQNNKNGVER